MRTSLKLLSIATLLLPGCILVTGDASPGSRSRSALEQRVASLESQMREMKECCESSACKCMGKEHEEGEDDEHEHAEHAGAH